MPLITCNLRNLILVTAVVGTLLLLFAKLGPKGISPASGMEMDGGQSFKNLNLKSSVLPIHFKGGDVAPGVSIKSDNVNVLVSTCIKIKK